MIRILQDTWRFTSPTFGSVTKQPPYRLMNFSQPCMHVRTCARRPACVRSCSGACLRRTRSSPASPRADRRRGGEARVRSARPSRMRTESESNPRRAEPGEVQVGSDLICGSFGSDSRGPDPPRASPGSSTPDPQAQLGLLARDNSYRGERLQEAPPLRARCAK